MSSPEEIQHAEETELANELRRRLAAGQPFVPDIEAIERHARRRYRRGLVNRGLAGVAVIGLAVAGGVAATSGGSSPREAAATTSATASAVKSSAVNASAVTVADVRKRVEAGQSPAGFLIRTEQTGDDVSHPSDKVTIWTDPATGNTMLLQGSGQARTGYWEHDYYQNRVLHWDQTQVNYGSRTWWTYDMHASGPVQGPVPSGPVGGDYTPASVVKALLGKGTWKIAGHPVVDGHRTVELAFSSHGVVSKIWADARTYQVVRTLKEFPGLPAVTADYYWVPKTTAMTKRINHPRIPAGFTRVAHGS